MPFTPDQPKSGFVPDSPIAETAKGVGSKLLSAAEGAGQGLTLGNVGNIGGGAMALANYLGPGRTDRELERQGFKISQPSAFDVGKQATNQELDRAYHENPWSYRAGYVGGSAPLAGAGRAVYNAGGKGVEGSMAVGGLQGALTDIENPDAQMDKGLKGMAFGGLLHRLAQGVQAGLGKAKEYAGKFARMSPAQSEAYLGDVTGTEQMAQTLGNPSENPQAMVGLENQARDAVQASRKALRQQGLQAAAQRSGLLKDKAVTLTPTELQGLDPRADTILENYTSKSPMAGAVGLPAQVQVPAVEADVLKRYLQEGADFLQGSVLDPVQRARQGGLAKAQGVVKTAIENVEPAVGPINRSMQEGALLSSDLRKGLKNPLAFVSSEAPGRMATLARAESRGAGGLFDFGNKMGAAKAIASKDVGSGITSSLPKAAGRAGLRASALFEQSVNELQDFPWLKQLLQESAQTK